MNKTVYKFDWGEAVELKKNSPIEYSEITQASVCGIREVDTEDIADSFNVSMGSVLYLVESQSGGAIEVPEVFLKKLD